MSANFEKVKRKLIADMAGTTQHTQESWADIMLRAARRCHTDEDQQDFFRFVLNPNESWEIQETTFMPIDSEPDVLIQKIQTMKVTNSEEEKQSEVEIKLENSIHTNGGTTFITVRPVECTS